MGKILIVVRHSKAAWPEGVVDHQRPLSGRGRRDALAVGRWLKARDLRPDTALVSSAQRTTQTYELIASELSAPPVLTLTDDIYNAGAGDLLDIVRGLGEARCALLIGHNPSVGTLAHLLDDETSHARGRSGRWAGFPTAATAVFDIAGDWAQLNPGEAYLVDFDAPRG